ncbi:MAG: PAS domain-containing sensor histidine kinase [Haloarcula sp.]
MSETEGTRFEALFEHTDDAVAEVEFVDGEPILRAVNPAFVELFGVDSERIRGEPLTEYVPAIEHRDDGAESKDRPATAHLQQGPVTGQTVEGAGQLFCRVVPTTAGRALAIYTDLTEKQRREQHHQVLHRVLRHNLRNKLVPLLDGTETLSTELSGNLGEQASLMAMAASELAELSEMAGKMEYVMDSAATTESRTDLVESVRSALEEYGDTAAVALSVEAPGPVVVAADDRLEIALAQLVENGVKHTDSELSVTVRREQAEAVVEISDDGPGLPENERAVLFGDEPITQLRHSTGLGLWLTKWILECHGGDLAYDRRDGRTTLTLRVPLATESAVADDSRTSQVD